jgi:hypothetical protein
MEQADIAKRIRELLPAETYGLKHYLLGEVRRDAAGNVWVDHDRTDIANGWECGDAALKVQTILRDEAGIESAICRGVSEDTIANVHMFVRDKSGTIYDGVPLYPTIGAKHRVKEVYSDEEIARHFGTGRLYIHTAMPPVTWTEDEGAVYLVAASVGLTYLITPSFPEPSCSATLFLVKKWGSIASCHEIHAKIDVSRYRKAGLAPLNEYRSEIARERLHELGSKNCLGIWGATVKPKSPLIPPDAKEHLEQNAHVLLSLLEKQAALIA